MIPLLSIMVPTTVDRRPDFDLLWNELNRQARGLPVELLFDEDNKEISIGAKRDRMYRRAKGLFSWQIDSDDWLHESAVAMIVEGIRKNPDADAICFKELCNINGEQKTSNFSSSYADWFGEGNLLPDGFNYHRTPFFKTAIKTDLCKRIGVADIRYGEDHDFARRIKPFIQTEVYIDEFIYHYIHVSKPEEHRSRYGYDRD